MEFNSGKDELLAKMKGWNPVLMRGLPWLPGFVLAGTFLQFFAIAPIPGSESGNFHLVDLSYLLNLTSETDRLETMKISMNLFKLILTLRLLMPRELPSLYQKVWRGEDSYVQLMNDHIIKVCKPTSLRIYDLLNPSNLRIPFSTSGKIVAFRTRDIVELEIRPVCFPGLPLSVKELCDAISCVLRAVSALHAYDLVHRDVRWPNVLKGMNGWLLTDFELCDESGSRFPDGIETQIMPPEYHSFGYLPTGDVYCVGRLVETWMKSHGHSLEEKRTIEEWCCWLINCDHLKRPSAEALLSDSSSWFARGL